MEPTYAWRIDSGILNVYQRVPNNLLDTRLPVIEIVNANTVEDAMNQLMVKAGIREGIALNFFLAPFTFNSPWSTTLTGCTLRDGINRISERAGPKVGWQYAWTKDFRQIAFHNAVLPKKEPVSH